MDDIQNILYIAVFVIWFLYRAFSGGKKKKQQPLPPVDHGTTASETQKQPTSAPVTFEDILRELSGAPPPAAPAENEEHYEDEPYYEEIESSFEVEEPVITPMPEPQQAPQQVVTDHHFKEFRIQTDQGTKAARDVFKLLKKKGGLKQAIILKEILDRPYS